MTDCLFCKIIAKQVPNYTVYEDADTLAFLDIFPHAKGHTVVIPKVHGATVFDLDDAVVVGLARAVKQTMARIEAVLHPDGFTVGWNHGEAGGQAVPHLHVHIMPRFAGDGGGSMHSVVKASSDLSVAEIAKLFS